MLLEIDEVAIDSGLWARVQRGEEQALIIVRGILDGMDLYLHNYVPSQGPLTISDNVIAVTLRQLREAKVIESVRIVSEKRPIEPTMEISLLPLDVGFDIKLTLHPVILNPTTLPKAQNYAIKHLDAAGEEAVATGDRLTVEKILKAAGYLIAKERKS